MLIKLPSMKECRFYEREFPDVDENVMVQIVRIEEHGAYACLLEYNHVEGMLLISELSKRRIRSISKLIRVGQVQCCAVLRVEKTGNIDLSKRRVTSEEAAAAETKYLNAKNVQGLMRHVATACDMAIEDVCAAISWPLYKSFNSAYDALRRLASGAADEVMAVIKPNITPDMETALMEVVLKRLTPEPLKIRADVEVSCFGFNGVEAVRAALIKGRAASQPDAPLSVRLVAAPQYMVTTSTFSKDLGLKTVETCVALIQEEIETQGGKFTLKHRTQIVGNDDAIIKESEEEDQESGSSDLDSEDEDDSDVSDE